MWFYFQPRCVHRKQLILRSAASSSFCNYANLSRTIVHDLNLKYLIYRIYYKLGIVDDVIKFHKYLE